jgi:hypothetical protein
MNVDRTARNTNMLNWNHELWLIDHGASLYFHHNWDSWEEQAIKPFVQVKDHVLLPQASELEKADAMLKPLLTKEVITKIISLVPGAWLQSDAEEASEKERREVYTGFIMTRLASSSIFIKAANDARQAII